MANTSKALKDVQPELEKLRQKAVSKVISYIYLMLSCLIMSIVCLGMSIFSEPDRRKNSLIFFVSCLSIFNFSDIIIFYMCFLNSCRIQSIHLLHSSDNLCTSGNVICGKHVNC